MKNNLLSTIAFGIIALFNPGYTSPNNDNSIDDTPGDDSSAVFSRKVVINDKRMSDENIIFLERKYDLHIPDGAYWYDRACGAWGMMGGPTKGFALAGLNVGGPLKENASDGTTGAVVNGRRLPLIDVQGLKMLLGDVWPGRFWVDARGNWGFEGSMMISNLWLMAQKRAGTGGTDGGPWAVYQGRYAGGGLVCGNGQGEYYAQFPGGVVW